MKYFADSSGWIALFDQNDKYHTPAWNWTHAIEGQRARFVTTDYVLDETITHLADVVNHATGESFATWALQQKHIQVVHVDEEPWSEALALFRKYDDKEFSFTDCTSFVVMHLHKIRDAFAFDRHFEQMGFRLWPR